MNGLNLKDRSELYERLAGANRQSFDAAGVTAFTIAGPAGSGKSSIIESLLLRLSPPLRSAVIMGNLAADRQISRITRHGYKGIPVNSDPFTAWHMHDVLPRLSLAELNMLFVEIEGNSLTPAEFNLGQHYRIGVFSAAGGDDKVNEFPLLVAKSDLVLLTKVDLLPYVKFDPKVFTDDIARLKPHLPLIRLSVQSGEGMDAFHQWIKNRITLGPINHETPRVFEPMVKFVQK